MTVNGEQSDAESLLEDDDLVPVGELGYTEAAEELDAIISELDRGVVDIDVLDIKLSRAVEIVEELDRRIRGARDRVGAILPRLEAVGQAVAQSANQPASSQPRQGAGQDPATV